MEGGGYHWPAKKLISKLPWPLCLLKTLFSPYAQMYLMKERDARRCQ